MNLGQPTTWLFAPTYEQGFESLTAGASETLLDLAGVGRGTTTLDIGTGPGTLIGPALERGATVSGVDLTPEMIEEARRRYPSADLVTADASSLPRPDNSFDAVTMGFCLHHTADPTAILDEAQRVLRPGGRIAFSVWAPAAQLEAFGLAFDVIGQLVQLDQLPALQAPSLGDEPADYKRLLETAGFTHPTARVLDLSWPMTDGAALFDGFERFLDLGQAPADTGREIRHRLDSAVHQAAGPDGIARLANPAIVAAAAKA